MAFLYFSMNAIFPPMMTGEAQIEYGFKRPWITTKQWHIWRKRPQINFK